MSLRLGIDVGTTGVRTAVLLPDGACLSTARSHHLPQGAQIDARKWWEAVAQCVHLQVTALERLGHTGTEVTGIAIAGTSGSMVLTDRALEPVSPALMYNSKGFEAEAAQIAQVAPEGGIAKGPNSALARALRLVSCADRAPAHLLHQADYVAARFLGAGGLSDHSNALRTGFDAEAEQWPPWVTALFEPGLLPRVQPVGSAYGQISGAVARDLGVSPQAVLYAGTTDSIAAFLAAAPRRVGAAVTSLGSTLAVYVMGPRRIEDAASGLHSHRVGNNWLVGGASNTGGAVLAHHFPGDALVRLSAQIDPRQPSGLSYYPLLRAGERFPINDPALAPCLSPRPERDSLFLHALLEGMATIEAQCYATIEQLGGGRPDAIYTAGGGAQNQAWSAIRARNLPAPLLPGAYTQPSIGVATLAKWQ
ncbi:MAG: FGGY-family carbohydrate kinase [Pseudomonadota bacterium]